MNQNMPKMHVYISVINILKASEAYFLRNYQKTDFSLNSEAYTRISGSVWDTELRLIPKCNPYACLYKCYEHT